MRLPRLVLILALGPYGCSDTTTTSSAAADAVSLDDVATSPEEDGHSEDEDGHTGEEDGHGHDPDAADEDHLHIDTEWPEAVKTGQNTLKIHLRDHDDAPITGATIVVDPQMPIHGHGSSEDPVVTELGEGNYEAFPVTFTMPGPWVVHVTATAKDEAGQTVERDISLDVDVPGAM